MAVSGARQRFTDFLSDAKRCRSRPRPPVPASQVPILFREPYILSGYRPVGQAWSCYVLSLFQRHNESVNVWTHLLAAGALLLRWGAEPPLSPWPPGAPGLPEQPLALFVGSALCYLCCSVAAHLLQSRSELAHYCLFFLDYVGVAVYQYGSALGHYFYGSEAAWRAGPPGPAFLPGAALLAWLSCAACCFAKSYWRRPYPPARRVCTLIPAGLAYLLVCSPLLHRLSAAGPWGPGLRLHAAHMALFLLSVLFFSCPVPERFLPGRCDFLGQGHQVFHMLLALCSVTQLEALLGDARRQGAGPGPGAFGEEEVLWACLLLPLVAGCCLLTALLAGRHKHRQLLAESGGGGGGGGGGGRLGRPAAGQLRDAGLTRDAFWRGLNVLVCAVCQVDAKFLDDTLRRCVSEAIQSTSSQQAHSRHQYGTSQSSGRAELCSLVFVPGPHPPLHPGLPHAQHHPPHPVHEVSPEPGERVRRQPGASRSGPGQRDQGR